MSANCRSLAARSLGVAGLDRDVDRTGRQVHGTDRVALHRRGLPGRHPVGEVRRLAAGPLDDAVPAGVDEPVRQVEVGAGAGLAEQLDQAHLDDGVTVDVHGLAGAVAERADQVVGVPDRDLEQRVVPGGTVLGHGRLVQVPGAVHLVAPLEVRVPLALPPDLLHGVEVAVVGLRLGVQGGDLALQRQQVVRRGAAVLPRHCLEPLRHVGVHEDRADRLALLEPGGDPEVPEVPGGLEQGVGSADRVAAVALLSERPEAPGDPGVPGGQRPERQARLGGREDRGRGVLAAVGRERGGHVASLRCDWCRPDCIVAGRKTLSAVDVTTRTGGTQGLRASACV